MKNTFSLFLVIALVAPETHGARPPRVGRNGPTVLAAPVPVAAVATIGDMKKACEAPDSFIAPLPKPSESPVIYRVDEATVDETKWPDLRFMHHCSTGTTRVPECDAALSLSLRSVREGKLALKKLREEVCQEKITEAEKCAKQANQADSLKCVHAIYNLMADDFRKTSDLLKARAKALKDVSENIQKAAKQFVSKRPLEIPERMQLRRTIAKVNGEALTGVSANRGPTQTAACATEVYTGGVSTVPTGPVPLPIQKVCSQITGASDTAFYSAQLTKAANDTDLAAKQFKEGAEIIGGNIDKSGNTNPGSVDPNAKKGGLLDSVGGLDGLMKMGTLGMMGAGLYCSVSGECSQKPSAITQPDPNAGLAATAPTPASTNPGPEVSKTGEPDKIVNNDPKATNPEVSTKTDPLGGSEGYSSTGSGFSGDKDQALAPFSGALDRAPATASSPGGGGGGGGGASDSSGSREPETETLKNGSSENGIGSGGGGGGLAHSGGFSLGDSAAASPTDSALKDILNGDLPPSDAGLASILEGDPGTTAGANGGIDIQGAESLFYRVRDTHVRCVKRGCVGHEVGEKI